MKKAKKALLLAIPDDPQELSVEYFDDNPKTYSRQVFDNLAVSPFFKAIFKSKPASKDMLVVSSVVIAAADQKISALEEERIELKKEASTIRAVLSNPIWSVRELPGPSNDQQDKSQEDEQKWIARYLTLGNVLGAFVVIAGLLGSTFAYVTSNYKEGATAWEKAANGYKTELANAETAKNAAITAQKQTEEAAKIQHESDARTIKDLNDGLSKSQTLSSGLSKQVDEANKKIAELQAAATSKQ